MSERQQKRTVGFVLFPVFELLDVFGPAEMFGVLKSRFRLVMLGPEAGPVQSAQGPRVVADRAYSDVDDLDLVLVPGGMGTREEVANEALLDSIRRISERVEYMTSVCTGSALLARAGVLNGRRATSNKLSLDWVMSQGPKVEWVTKARWVSDGKFWTSSGVTAGMDMSLALIEHMHGPEVAEKVATGTEYERHKDATWDPFARS